MNDYKASPKIRNNCPHRFDEVLLTHLVTQTHIYECKQKEREKSKESFDKWFGLFVFVKTANKTCDTAGEIVCVTFNLSH